MTDGYNNYASAYNRDLHGYQQNANQGRLNGFTSDFQQQQNNGARFLAGQRFAPMTSSQAQRTGDYLDQRYAPTQQQYGSNAGYGNLGHYPPPGPNPTPPASQRPAPPAQPPVTQPSTQGKQPSNSWVESRRQNGKVDAATKALAVAFAAEQVIARETWCTERGVNYDEVFGQILRELTPRKATSLWNKFQASSHLKELVTESGAHYDALPLAERVTLSASIYRDLTADSDKKRALEERLDDEALGAADPVTNLRVIGPVGKAERARKYEMISKRIKADVAYLQQLNIHSILFFVSATTSDDSLAAILSTGGTAYLDTLQVAKRFSSNHFLRDFRTCTAGIDLQTKLRFNSSKPDGSTDALRKKLAKLFLAIFNQARRMLCITHGINIEDAKVCIYGEEKLAALGLKLVITTGSSLVPVDFNACHSRSLEYVQRVIPPVLAGEIKLVAVEGWIPAEKAKKSKSSKKRRLSSNVVEEEEMHF